MSSSQTQATELETLYNNLLRDITNEISPDLGGGSILNILTKYDWSLNYQGTEAKIPFVSVNEYRQNLSTFAASLSWFMEGVLSAVGLGTGKNEELIKQSNTAFFDSIDKTVNSTDKSEKTYSDFLANYQKVKNNSFESNLKQFNGLLSPYSFMYSLTDENCLKYIFPYFETDFLSLRNSFGDVSQTGSIGEKTFNDQVEAFGGLTSLMGNARSIGSLLSNDIGWNDQGIYIEKPKYFQFETSGDNIILKFSLYNTLHHPGQSEDPWKKNYRFIKNFAFKNLPFKISMFRYKTPALYEVSIPGSKYFPISYVSNFQVASRGTRRYLTYKSSEVLVPDAWDISITFQSLLCKSANLFQAALQKGPTIIT